MAEVYPSDNELLAITSDNETNVEYIPTGTVPYYLEFRKLLYRLLLASKRANDLRVYKAGGLDIGVKPGRYWVGVNLVSYGGTGLDVPLADDKANIYIYLDSAGTLVINEYTGWPDMTSSPHVRLAVVTTVGGDITSLADARDHHSIAMPSSGGGGAGFYPVEDHTANDTLTEAESGSVHTNRGASGTITLTLPASASEGTMFTFCVQAVGQLRVDPGTATIRDDCGQTADKYKWADAIGECLQLVADSSGDWITLAKRGTWSEEA